MLLKAVVKIRVFWKSLVFVRVCYLDAPATNLKSGNLEYVYHVACVYCKH